MPGATLPEVPRRLQPVLGSQYQAGPTDQGTEDIFHRHVEIDGRKLQETVMRRQSVAALDCLRQIDQIRM